MQKITPKQKQMFVSNLWLKIKNQQNVFRKKINIKKLPTNVDNKISNDL